MDDAARLLTSARRRARLTQAALAQRAGTSQATLSSYESGRKQPGAATLARILAAAGMRLTIEPAPYPNGDRFAEVLELAESQPVQHDPASRYPRLPSSSRAQQSR